MSSIRLARSASLLDEQAVLSCSLYVDLNPVRAGVAATPEDSRFTAARERIEASQAREKLARLKDQGVEVTSEAQRRLIATATEATRRDDWLSTIGSPAGFLPGLTLARYLALLDWTGRQIADGKRGVIPSDLAPILERLAINVDLWVDTVTRFGRVFRRAAGSAPAMCAEALRVSRNWLQGISTARRAFRVA